MAGTSLSAPLAAGLFTLANQKLMSMGYQKIGYANPMLYWMADNCPSAFNDITIGDNQAGEEKTPCLVGFPAAPGWDAVTGLGSIKFDPFVECAMKYQDTTLRSGNAAPPEASTTSGDNLRNRCFSLLFVCLTTAIALVV